MLRKNLSGVVCAFVIGLLVSTSVVVYAASASSSWKSYGPVLEYSYKNRASITTLTSGAQPSTTVGSTSGAAPAGYMGCCTRLYNTSNVLVSQSKWIFNDDPNITTIIYGGPWTNTQGTYYSKGQTAAYNGDGYNHYDTNKSPNLSF